VDGHPPSGVCGVHPSQSGPCADSAGDPRPPCGWGGWWRPATSVRISLEFSSGCASAGRNTWRENVPSLSGAVLWLSGPEPDHRVEKASSRHGCPCQPGARPGPPRQGPGCLPAFLAEPPSPRFWNDPLVSPTREQRLRAKLGGRGALHCQSFIHSTNVSFASLVGTVPGERRLSIPEATPLPGPAS
jgi:hypothetical protein